MSDFSVDINCDAGESFGAYHLGNDEKLLDYVTSVNIACGFHAGDPSVMRKTVRLALEKNVAIGAHPGLPDLAGFGRREMAVSPEEVHDLVIYQVGALAAFAKAEGGILRHVKPHGALYNMAAVNGQLAEAIAEAVYKINPELILFGLAGSKLTEAAARAGLRCAGEVFADRTYQQDGTLTSRRLPEALIVQHEKAVQQALRMVKENKVTTLQGTEIAIKADTVCVHGDSPQAVEFAARLHTAMLNENIRLKAL